MIKLSQLSARLGSDLFRVSKGPVPELFVTGVHISELDDPTPYLDGGELLLTTGIPFSSGDEHVCSYVKRLVQHGVTALGLGLGAGKDRVPPALETACRAAGLELLAVPSGTPFMKVSRAYWDSVGKSEQAHLMATLSMQTSLTQAATRPEAVESVVKALAGVVGGWAAYMPVDGSSETFWPASERGVLPSLREETRRLSLAGIFSSATFPLHGMDVVEYSIVVGKRTAGFLAVGAGRALRKTDRQLMLTGCMLLSVIAQQEWELTRALSILGSTAATLILNGYVDAARLAVSGWNHSALTERVRVLAMRGCELDGLASWELADLVAGLTGELPAELHRSIAESVLRCSIDGVSYVILADSAVAKAVSVASRMPARNIDVAAALSSPLLLNDVPGGMGEISRACRTATPGTIVTVGSLRDPSVERWVAQLRDYPRVDLIGTVQCYLRNRGHWETTARDLAVHRNSLRHRIGVAEQLIGADLDDPDVASNLWLALRRRKSEPVS
jgi:purine catabolism regulator